MQTRTLYALIATALVAASGAALAQPSEPAKTAAPAFMLKISPAEAWIKGGETATFSVVAEARDEKTITLAVRAADGLSATLASTTLDLVPGAASRTALSVAGPENATRSPFIVVVSATDQDGLVRDAKVAIHLRDVGHKPAERPAEKPGERSSDKAPPVDVLRQILDRLDRMEKRIAALETRDRPAIAPVAPIPHKFVDDVAKGVRMTLSPEHAILPVEGGKVALLLASETGGRVALGLRYNETSGWSAKLEQEAVHVPAGGRAWVWIQLTPPEGATAAPLEYGVVQLIAPGAPVTKGIATLRMA